MTIKEATQLLELTAPFSKAALKKAYRDALMVWHPDRFEGNTELKAKAESRTCQINEAYALLSRIPESDYPYRAIVEGQHTKQPPSSNPQRANAGPSSRPQPQPPRTQSSSPPQRTENPTQPPIRNPFKKLDSLLNSPRAIRVYSTVAWIMVTPFVVWLLVSTLIRWNRESDQRSAANIYTAPTPPSNSTLTPEFRTPSVSELLEPIRMDNRIRELEREANENAKAMDKLMHPFDFTLRPRPSSVPSSASPNAPTQLKADTALKHLASDERLTSGSILTDLLKTFGGKGKLTLDNGLTEDAFVKMLSDDRLVASFYVRGREKFTFAHVPDGVYRLIYCTGFGWDTVRRDFERGRHAMCYDEALDFTTTRRTEGNTIITSTGVITLTLHKVANGNAKTSDIPLEEFDRY